MFHSVLNTPLISDAKNYESLILSLKIDFSYILNDQATKLMVEILKRPGKLKILTM